MLTWYVWKIHELSCFFTMKDGSKLDGIIESVDENYVIVLVGEDIVDYGCENESYEQRQFGGPRRFRRFRRRVFHFHL